MKTTGPSRALLILRVASVLYIAAVVPWTTSLDAQERPRIPAVFQPFYGGPIFPDERAAAVRGALPYDRISLERSGGMMIPGGHFKLTLLKNGDATLWNAWGGSQLGTAGDFVGVVNLFDFGKLSHLIAQNGLETMAPRFETNWSDMQAVTLTISMKGREISVADYGGAAPVEFWAIEQALEAISHRIRWKAK